MRLGLGHTHAFAEQIGIATEVVGRSERDRIDAVLHHDQQPPETLARPKAREVLDASPPRITSSPTSG